METPRKFIIAELSIRKLGSSFGVIKDWEAFYVEKLEKLIKLREKQFTKDK